MAWTFSIENNERRKWRSPSVFGLKVIFFTENLIFLFYSREVQPFDIHVFTELLGITKINYVLLELYYITLTKHHTYSLGVWVSNPHIGTSPLLREHKVSGPKNILERSSLQIQSTHEPLVWLFPTRGLLNSFEILITTYTAPHYFKCHLFLSDWNVIPNWGCHFFSSYTAQIWANIKVVMHLTGP